MVNQKLRAESILYIQQGSFDSYQRSQLLRRYLLFLDVTRVSDKILKKENVILSTDIIHETVVGGQAVYLSELLKRWWVG